MGFLNPWIYSIGSHAFTEYVEASFLSPSSNYAVQYADPSVVALPSPSQWDASAKAI